MKNNDEDATIMFNRGWEMAGADTNENKKANNPFINIQKNEQNLPIYRFASIEKVLRDLFKNQNTLVSPRKWDDPWENILEKVIFKESNGNSFKHPLRDRFYGQCWTLTEETDAAWRIYTPEKNGVRLKTTIGKLLKKFQQGIKKKVEYQRQDAINAPYYCYIGRVQYQPDEEISAFFSNEGNLLGVGSQGDVETLLFKRKEFEHEQEIRLIYYDVNNAGREDLYTYPMNASGLIEEITFDPRMDEELYKAYSYCIKNFGYTGSIEKSTLYRVPNFKIDCDQDKL